MKVEDIPGVVVDGNTVWFPPGEFKLEDIADIGPGMVIRGPEAK